MKALFISVVTGLFLFSGCYYDSKDYLYPTLSTVCTDTISPVTYDGVVAKILSDNNCSGCHSGGSPSGGILLDSYANVKLQVDNGQFLGSILRTGAYTGSKAMPPGGALDDCELSALKKWINNSAPQK
jgi:mono/diheme cytochrome c family protein